MENLDYNQLFNVAFQAIALIFAFIVLVKSRRLLDAAIKFAEGWVITKLQTLDGSPALVSFGQSPIGQVMHDQLGVVRSYVDNPSDPLILKAVELALTILPQKPEMLTAEELSEGSTKAVDFLRQLTDGVAGNLQSPPMTPPDPLAQG